MTRRARNPVAVTHSDTLLYKSFQYDVEVKREKTAASCAITLVILNLPPMHCQGRSHDDPPPGPVPYGVVHSLTHKPVGGALQTRRDQRRLLPGPIRPRRQCSDQKDGKGDKEDGIHNRMVHLKEVVCWIWDA
jgi:hypothetical protein